MHPLKIRNQQHQRIQVIFESGLSKSCNNGRVRTIVHEKNSIQFLTYGLWGHSVGRDLLFYHCPDGAHTETFARTYA